MPDAPDSARPIGLRPWSATGARAAFVSTYLLLAGLAPPDSSSNQELLEAHNHVRAEAKLPPLRLNPKLNAAALAHAEDMAKREMMTHEGADGSTPAQRVERKGYDFRATAENVARGQMTVKSVMKSWMDSPPHKENILGKSEEVGFGKVEGDNGQFYWCADFGTPWPTPSIAEARSGLIDRLNRERTAAGKKSLTPNKILNDVATHQAEGLASAASLQAPKAKDDAPDVGKTLQDAGYRFRSLAQLSAAGLALPEELYEALAKEKANRETLLGEFSEIGVGYARSSKSVPYWSLILGSPAGGPKRPPR